jgi:hypothetical protein
MNRAIASTLAALAMMALPPMALARNQPTLQSISFQLGGAPKVTLAAAAVRGGHTLSFLQSSEHPPGTVLPAGTVVHNCAQPLSGTVGVTVDATGYTRAAFGVVVKVGAAAPIGVSSPQKGMVQFQGNITLAQNSAHMVEVTVGTAPASKPVLHFNLVLKCASLPSAVVDNTPSIPARPPVTVAKPLGPMPAEVSPPQAGKGPALPPSNVKLTMACVVKSTPDGWFAEVRPKYPWLNPPATARITVNVALLVPPYPTPNWDYFKLPPSLWSPGGPHARVTLPQPDLTGLTENEIIGLALGPLPTCTAIAEPMPDTTPGHALTP